jgi:butyryl-CoA dehydrogenase
MEDGKAYQVLVARFKATIDKALQVPALEANARSLSEHANKIDAATKAAWSTGKPSEALANAVPYMQAFGHAVLAWIWLDVGMSCVGKSGDAKSSEFVGRLGAMQFFFNYELPKIDAWLNVVSSRDSTCADLPENAF